MSQTTITAASALPLDLADAKNHLRIIGGELDTEVLAALEAAVDYCESVSARALRESLEVSQVYCAWPRDGVFRFDRQPVKEIASIEYWHASGVLQELPEVNYRLHASTVAAAYLYFDTGFLQPDLFQREDAVTVNYVAGYDSPADVPERAKYAIKLKLAELFGNLDPRMVDANRRACDDLLRSIDWGSYR